jgi:pSer/pThr/pTyr-binding forkhead associated (FHA) protein
VQQWSAHSATPVELKERLAADRAGRPYLIYRDTDGAQRIFTLPDDRESVTIGRGEGCAICLWWDAEVSRVHAQLERVGPEWTVLDDNLSRNGTFVDGERLHGRARLRSGTLVRCGATELAFRAPMPEIMETAPPRMRAQAVELSPAQKRVLVALCRQFTPENAFPRPASNKEIADELVLSIPAVKTQLRALFDRFGVEDLPNNEKRARLVELALSTGTVTPRDLAPR